MSTKAATNKKAGMIQVFKLFVQNGQCTRVVEMLMLKISVG